MAPRRAHATMSYTAPLVLSLAVCLSLVPHTLTVRTGALQSLRNNSLGPSPEDAGHTSTTGTVAGVTTPKHRETTKKFQICVGDQKEKLKLMDLTEYDAMKGVQDELGENNYITNAREHGIVEVTDPDKLEVEGKDSPKLLLFYEQSYPESKRACDLLDEVSSAIQDCGSVYIARLETGSSSGSPAGKAAYLNRSYGLTKYKVTYIPTFVLVHPDGVHYDRLEGNQSVQRFLSFISSSRLEMPTTGVHAVELGYDRMGSLFAAMNQMRQQYRVKPLSWDDSLALRAQQRANSFRMDHCVHLPTETGNIGELVQSLDSDNGVAPWSRVVDSYNLGHQYDFVNQNCGDIVNPNECKLFTQTLWKSTKMTGCGYARCTQDSGRWTELWVCEYEPKGNILGQEGENVQDVPTDGRGY